MPMYPPWSRSEKHRPGEGSLSSLNKTCTAYCIFALGIICSSICDEVHKPQFSNLLTLCSCRKSERGSCWRSPGQAAKAHLFEVDSHGARRLVQRQLGTVDTQVPLLLLLLASEAAKKFTMQIRFCLNFANELEILVRPLSLTFSRHALESKCNMSGRGRPISPHRLSCLHLVPFILAVISTILFSFPRVTLDFHSHMSLSHPRNLHLLRTHTCTC